MIYALDNQHFEGGGDTISVFTELKIPYTRRKMQKLLYHDVVRQWVRGWIEVEQI